MKTFEKFCGNLFEMNGYNISIIAEKNNELVYDMEFEKNKLEAFCKKS